MGTGALLNSISSVILTIKPRVCQEHTLCVCVCARTQATRKVAFIHGLNWALASWPELLPAALVPGICLALSEIELGPSWLLLRLTFSFQLSCAGALG